MKAMKVSLLSLLVAVLVVGGFVLFSHHSNPASNLVTDVSWPNCKDVSPTISTWGVVGVTGGLDFHPNPCAELESTWFAHVSLYENTGYPGTSFGLKYK